MAPSENIKNNVQYTGPYTSLRDYVSALEARGRLLRIEKMDQDAYEATAFVYRMVERYGYDDAPAILIEKIKSGGQWHNGPMIGNLFPGFDAEAMVYGAPQITHDQGKMFRATRDHLIALAGPAGRWERVKPIEGSADDAPCKDIRITGEDVDLHAFPWLQTNPGDAGAYINSAAIFMEDPDLGRNVATYRCQVKDKRRIGFNTEIGQGGWQILMAHKRRGAKEVKAALALGCEPLIYALAASKVTRPGEDELEIVGGLRGAPVELVPCETSDLKVPAHAEIILEGTVTFDMEEEGPYGELYGYMGQKKPQNFVMTVDAITHRHDPWFVNSFAGIVKLAPSSLGDAGDHMRFKQLIPGLVDIYSPNYATGITIVSIDKKTPGDGVVAGQFVAAGKFFSKAIIVVDKDIDPFSLTEVLHAMGTRWQPHPASQLIEQTKGMVLDPSAPKRGVTSKMIIDATKQFPQEGGPDPWPDVSKVLLQNAHPQAFDLVDDQWQDYWQDYSWPE